jgi:transcriptional regulator with XRE-family HTH domain
MASRDILWRECGVSDGEMSVSQSLLAELRRARSVARLSQEEFGKAINYSSSLVSAVENGQRPATREYLVSVDKALSTGGLFERLLSSLVSIEQAPVWFRDWLKVEREATLIRWFEPVLVPGLLQTRAYAHAIVAGARLVGEAEVQQIVATRMQRQGVLARPKPPDLIAIIDEGVLRRRIGGADVMAAQCKHLLACTEQPTIQIHVVPAEAGAYAGLAGAFALAKGHDFETAQLETPWQSQVSDQQNAIDSLIRRWEAIRSEALPRAQSIELIKRVGTAWQT